MEKLSVEIKDPLIGTVINGRYEIQRLAETDELSKLYSGYDSETNAVVGIRVTETAMEHRRLHEWLGAAIMTRGRFAILAVGHFDRKRSYLVLSEAALTILRPRPGQFDDDEDALDDRALDEEDASDEAELAARCAKGDEPGQTQKTGAGGDQSPNETTPAPGKRSPNVLELFSNILKKQSR